MELIADYNIMGRCAYIAVPLWLKGCSWWRRWVEDIWGPERNRRITASQAGTIGTVKGNLILRISRSDLRLIAFVSARSAFAGEVVACRGAFSK